MRWAEARPRRYTAVWTSADTRTRRARSHTGDRREGARQAAGGHLACWCSVDALGATRAKITRFELSFDVYTMQFKLQDDVMQLPSTGLARTYNVAEVVKYQTRQGNVGTFLVCGSSELLSKENQQLLACCVRRSVRHLSVRVGLEPVS